MKNSFIENTPAILALEDGTVLRGSSVGVDGITVGEMIFNTSMSGYQEVLTDPSYTSQIVLFTSPHIGNVGVCKLDNESNRIWASGMVVRDFCDFPSNWRAYDSLSSFLKKQEIVAISGVDTRYLTARIREKGSIKVCIMSGQCDEKNAVTQAVNFSGLLGQNLTSTVTRDTLSERKNTNVHPKSFEVMAYDFGMKHSIINILEQLGCHVTLVPAEMDPDDIIAQHPDGIFLSNGPGDPDACDLIIRHMKKMIALDIPLFGICLGHQLLALACGAKTYKMKFGHHGANHPVLDMASGRVHITSQNHGFTVDYDGLPSELKATHVSLFDRTLQGFKHINKPVMGFQGHPEAGPGPNDMRCVFEHFITMMDENRRKR